MSKSNYFLTQISVIKWKGWILILSAFVGPPRSWRDIDRSPRIIYLKGDILCEM